MLQVPVSGSIELSNLERFYDLMGYESEINKLIDKIPIGSLTEESAKDIQNEYRAKIISRISELYSEEQIESLINFFESDLGHTWLENQRNLIPNYPEFMRELLEKHVNTSGHNKGPHFTKNK